jgi:hypothetical protein
MHEFEAPRFFGNHEDTFLLVGNMLTMSSVRSNPARDRNDLYSTSNDWAKFPASQLCITAHVDDDYCETPLSVHYFMTEYCKCFISVIYDSFLTIRTMSIGFHEPTERFNLDSKSDI